MVLKFSLPQSQWLWRQSLMLVSLVGSCWYQMLSGAYLVTLINIFSLFFLRFDSNTVSAGYICDRRIGPVWAGRRGIDLCPNKARCRSVALVKGLFVVLTFRSASLLCEYLGLLVTCWNLYFEVKTEDILHANCPLSVTNLQYWF